MVDALGWLAVVVGFGGTLALMADRGYRDGLRLAWFLATLVIPGWFTVTFRSITVDAVSGVGLATLIATLYQPFTGTRVRWALCDVLVGLVVLASVASDVANRALVPGFLFEQIRIWVLPYLVGRLFLRSWNDAEKCLPLVVPMAAGLAIYGIIEAFTQVNVLAVASGKTWDLLETAEGFRWGLKRAQGTTNHPIYFGLLLSLILPWVLVAVRGPGPGWWKIVPYLVAGSALVTVSRSAHLAIVLVLAADLFFRRPNLRGPMLALALIGGLAFLAFRQDVLDLLGSYAGEPEASTEQVKINGVLREYSGTRHRDLLLEVYDDAIEQAGPFGYGSMMLDMPKDPFMDPRFASIDHQYLLQWLRYGYLGTAAVLLFAAGGAITLARVAWRRDRPEAALAAGLCGAFVAVTLMLRGVAFSGDFQAMWLFAAGLGASWLGKKDDDRPIELAARR